MITWIEIQSDDSEKLKIAAQEFGVHPLVLEDCLNRDQRPKLEDYETHQFLVWFMMAEGRLYEIQFLIFPDKLIFVPHDAPPSGASWREYLKVNEAQKDVWHLLYLALDRATDVTWSEVRRLFAKVDEFEDQIFETECNPQTILKLKKHLIQVDYSIGHLSSVAEQIQKFSKPKDDLNWKLRDLHDHCERVYRSIALYRSQVATSIDLYWGYQAHKTNRHVKKLSLLASVSVPLTFWASFWGMNFEWIPFKSESLFYSAIAVMFTSVALTYWLLKRKGYWED